MRPRSGHKSVFLAFLTAFAKMKQAWVPKLRGLKKTKQNLETGERKREFPSNAHQLHPVQSLQADKDGRKVHVLPRSFLSREWRLSHSKEITPSLIQQKL